MENITVFSNRLDESNGTVENVLEMKAKKTPWHLRFAPKAKGIVSFVQNLLSPLTRKESVRGGQLSAFFQLAAAVVVGIGLLAGSLFLLAEPVGTGRGGNNPPIVNVCAPTVEAIWITEDQHLHQFTVEVTLSSGGWEQFPRNFWKSSYTLKGSGWRYHSSRSPFWVDYVNDYPLAPLASRHWVAGLEPTHVIPWVYLDLPRSSGGSSYSFELEPAVIGGDGFAYFRGKYYNWYDHWIDISLCLGDMHPITGKPLTGVTPYRGHAWISPRGPSESGGYYVPVHFRRSSSSEWETLGNY